MLNNKITTQVSKTSQKGVTLLEMMITLAILAIVLTVVAPSMQNFLIKNRITGEINEVSGIVQYARHLAIDEQINVVVCPSEDFEACGTNWNNPKIVFIDSNADGNRNSDEELLVATAKASDSTKMTGPNTSINFQYTGAASRSFSIQLCPINDDATVARAILVSLQGRVKVSSDADDNGTHEDMDGVALNCP
ncbi:MAG: type IV fimbrial biogenesis protein FimT [Bermanella sp.]|uniref:GspH/FimT family pseudopilin n=1 Tax=Glaciecola sp. 33A TaxID=2057807 RepID=UPI000C3307B4|nr:GspH/FimT family pseudopilin [Glaciecola sp. 33A]PKI01572.1 pilus assembly protein [Glaciecola sp. 33A]